MRRRERKFGRNERREKNSEQISVVWGGVRSIKNWFFNFYKVYSSLSKMKGYCTLSIKI
jgi:hypothetical protein